MRQRASAGGGELGGESVRAHAANRPTVGEDHRQIKIGRHALGRRPRLTAVDLLPERETVELALRELVGRTLRRHHEPH